MSTSSILKKAAHRTATPTIIASTILAIGASTYHWSLFFIISIGSDVIFALIYYWLVRQQIIRKDNMLSINQQLVKLQVVFWLIMQMKKELLF